MELAYILVILAAVLATDLLLRGLGVLARRVSGFPYKRRRVFLDVVHAGLFDALNRALGHEYRVLAQVPLSSVVDADPKLRKRPARHALELIGDLRFDFLIVAKADAFPVCAIELGAREPERPRLRKRQAAYVKAVCKAADIPHIRVEEELEYDQEELRRRVQAAAETLGVNLAMAEEVDSGDEDAVLDGLSAAIRDGDDPMVPGR